MKYREKIAEIIKKNGTYNGRSLSFDYYVVQPDDLATALIENGIGDVAEKDAEIACLTAENAELRATLSKMETVEKELRERLEKAVELPCIEPMTTWDWDENTGCWKARFGKFWKVLYRDNDGEFIAYIGATKEEATAMLAELKGEKK